mmetsp:Transcript_1027/g.1090  ORF Transcript_1027/g.1090 Transcript_1027/m.1090 type:complete len:213 (+) Transcript_1027:297-935(+)
MDQLTFNPTSEIFEFLSIESLAHVVCKVNKKFRDYVITYFSQKLPEVQLTYQNLTEKVDKDQSAVQLFDRCNNIALGFGRRDTLTIQSYKNPAEGVLNVLRAVFILLTQKTHPGLDFALIRKCLFSGDFMETKVHKLDPHDINPRMYDTISKIDLPSPVGNRSAIRILTRWISGLLQYHDTDRFLLVQELKQTGRRINMMKTRVRSKGIHTS